MIFVGFRRFWCENMDFGAKKSFAQKLTLFGELRRFRRHSDLRAEISLLTPSRSSKKIKLRRDGASWSIINI